MIAPTRNVLSDELAGSVLELLVLLLPGVLLFEVGIVLLVTVAEALVVGVVPVVTVGLTCVACGV